MNIKALGGFIGVLILLVQQGCLVGCQGTRGLFSTTGDDMARFLESPAVQTTLDKWSARADLTNPRFGVLWGTIGEARIDGVIVRGEAAGSGAHSGIDPVLYKWLVDIAKERGYEPPVPTTQPAESTLPADAPGTAPGG